MIDQTCETCRFYEHGMCWFVGWHKFINGICQEWQEKE